ncbi:unnamed protein product [Bursaphelenchus xylophilus]|uniref:(pine wood nematode) hypothetical protein n=1 Tax=Bursaphelenchus xylophilus TaxID=6326 RepID=A0A7I8WSS9_BURXY|nr:unnamed protein product [Bursaphelenchus xylophilus]CAG9115671.1 unnamed protein product [Bursaphelenchus xylophilus]
MFIRLLLLMFGAILVLFLAAAAFLDIGWQCDSIKWRIIPDSAVSIWTSTSKSIESRCSQTAQSCATRAH